MGILLWNGNSHIWCHCATCGRLESKQEHSQWMHGLVRNVRKAKYGENVLMIVHKWLNGLHGALIRGMHGERRELQPRETHASAVIATFGCGRFDACLD